MLVLLVLAIAFGVVALCSAENSSQQVIFIFAAFTCMAGLIVADRQDAGHVLPQTNRLNNPHHDGRTARRRGVANPRRRG